MDEDKDKDDDFGGTQTRYAAPYKNLRKHIDLCERRQPLSRRILGRFLGGFGRRHASQYADLVRLLDELERSKKEREDDDFGGTQIGHASKYESVAIFLDILERSKREKENKIMKKILILLFVNDIIIILVIYGINKFFVN